MLEKIDKNKIKAINNIVGINARKLRVGHCIETKDMANTLGISCYKLHRFEKGASHLDVARLWYYAKLFKRDISYFFEDLD